MIKFLKNETEGNKTNYDQFVKDSVLAFEVIVHLSEIDDAIVD